MQMNRRRLCGVLARAVPGAMGGLALAGLGSLGAQAAAAQPATAGGLTVEQAWARPTVPGQSAGGGFLTIHNPGAADRLLGIEAGVSGMVELHTMAMQGDVMQMRRVGAINVPAGRSVQLKPGGLHVMFMGLKAPLKQGDTFPLKLKFERAGEVTVPMTVRVHPPPPVALLVPAKAGKPAPAAKPASAP
jgi:periplasmic copper chaperone A